MTFPYREMQARIKTSGCEQFFFMAGLGRNGGRAAHLPADERLGGVPAVRAGRGDPPAAEPERRRLLRPERHHSGNF